MSSSVVTPVGQALFEAPSLEPGNTLTQRVTWHGEALLKWMLRAGPFRL
jgi:hypothetical protein